MEELVGCFTAALGFTAQEFIQWRYGVPGLVGLALLAVGIKTRNQTCSTIGAIVLALTVSRPAL